MWCNANDFSVSAWISQSGLLESARACRETLDTMFEASYVLGEVHGASFLGASCVRAFRLAAFDTPNEPDSCLIESWSICGSIVSLLGKVGGVILFTVCANPPYFFSNKCLL